MNKSKQFAILICIISVSIIQKLYAQDNETKKYNPVEVSVTMETNHYWRGIAVNDVPVIEPSVYYHTRDNSFNIGVWYNNAISGTYKEFDFYTSYTKKGFIVAVWDIFNFDNANADAYNTKQFFNYNADETGHFIDFDLGYTLQGNYKASVYSSTVILGRDRGWDNKKNLYSNYTQLNLPVLSNRGVNVSVFGGFAFAFKPDHNLNAEGVEQKGTFYTINRNADFTNIGVIATKTVNVLHHPIPLTATVGLNPNRSEAHVDLAAVLF